MDENPNTCNDPDAGDPPEYNELRAEQTREYERREAALEAERGPWREWLSAQPNALRTTEARIGIAAEALRQTGIPAPRLIPPRVKVPEIPEPPKVDLDAAARAFRTIKMALPKLQTLVPPPETDDRQPEPDEVAVELASGGLVDTLAQAARDHGCIVTISVTPYDDPEGDDQ